MEQNFLVWCENSTFQILSLFCFSVSAFSMKGTGCLKKIQWSPFEDLIGFIQWFMNREASHLTKLKKAPRSWTKWEVFISTQGGEKERADSLTSFGEWKNKQKAFLCSIFCGTIWLPFQRRSPSLFSFCSLSGSGRQISAVIYWDSHLSVYLSRAKT